MTERKKDTYYLDFYAPEPLVEENAFLKTEPDRTFPKNLPESRHLLPEPFWQGHEAAIDCYWKVWDLAFRNLKQVSHGNGFISPYIDTAFNDCLFMWDSAFILMFARYGSRAFDFQRTLDNFYAKQHPDGFISREIQEWDGRDRFHPFDPVSTGPNVLPWCEWEYYLNFGDVERLGKVFAPLVAYYRWTRKHRSWPDGSYWSTGFGCGMDNQPRVPPGASRTLDHGHMSWIDATAQAVLAAKMLIRMAEALGRTAQVADLVRESGQLTDYMNRHMWREERQFYFDRLRDGNSSGTKTIGAYWTLLAGAVPPERLAAFVAHLDNEATFNRPHRVPSLSADHPDYDPAGGYWRGAVWPPTNYMVLRGLTAAGFDGLAAAIGRNHHDNVVKVFEKTGTVWENYAGESAAPGDPAKSDFVGWGGVGPVAVFLEYVLGLRADVPAGKLVWDVHLAEAHGVKRYPFGKEGLIDLGSQRRASATDAPRIDVKSNIPVELEVHWPGGKRTIAVKAS
jgi:hypothetical protein